SGPRLLDRAGHAVGDEGEGRSAPDERLARVMGDDEHGHVERRLVPPPAAGVCVVLPGSFAAAEHASAHYNGAVGAKVLRHQLVVRAGLAAGEAMWLAPALEPKGPLVQLVAAFAERLLERGVRSGDVAIERQRDLGDDFAHFRSLRG